MAEQRRRASSARAARSSIVSNSGTMSIADDGCRRAGRTRPTSLSSTATSSTSLTDSRLGDHVVRDGRRAVASDRSAATRRARRARLDASSLYRARAAQRTRRRQLARQAARPARLVETRVRRAHPGGGEQLGDHRLVHGRVLAQVEPAEVRAERRDRPAHRLDDARSARAPAPCVAQRVARRRRGRPTSSSIERTAPGDSVAERRPGTRPSRSTSSAKAYSRACMPAQRPAVRLVGPERRRVAGRVGERQERGGRCHEPRRHRQLDARARCSAAR